MIFLLFAVKLQRRMIIAWQAEEGKGEHYEPEIEDLRAEIIFIETSDFFKKSCSVSIDKVIDNGLTSVVGIVFIFSQVGYSGSSKKIVFYFHTFRTAIYFLYARLSFNDTIPMWSIEMMQYSASFLTIHFSNRYFLKYRFSTRRLADSNCHITLCKSSVIGIAYCVNICVKL